MNRHFCHAGCLSKIYQTCKSRFPRLLFLLTLVDPETGAINLKKGEAWINFFTPLFTYVTMGNTDITSLLSGTAIKAIVAYVTDYITKSALKTHTIFQAVKSVFAKINLTIHT